MSWSCRIGLHKWAGCRCSECGAKRDTEHKWERYRCQVCGATRPEEATISTMDPMQSALLEHKYLADNPCLCGGTWQMVSHSSPIPSGTSEMVCKCSKCGAKQIFLFRLVSGAASPSSRKQNVDSGEFFEAISRGDLKVVNDLLARDVGLINVRGPMKMTPLYMAAVRCQEAVARLLVEQGADVNAQKDDGWTPLHHACQNGDVAIVTLLLDNGADPSIRSRGGQTPLHVAAYGVTETTIRTLEAEWAATHRENRPILDPESVVRLLISRGADINAVEPQHGATPLHLAIFRGQRGAVRALLDCGADVNARSKKGTPLHVAAGRCDEDLVTVLLEKGADINAIDDDNRIPRDVIGLASGSFSATAKANVEKLLIPSR